MKLSKREIVMLVALLILAIVFIEYRFVVVPGLARLDERKAEQAELSEQVAQIKLNLATIGVLEDKLQENIDLINSQSKPFYDGIKPDSLLDLSRTLLLRNGLEINEYTTKELAVEPINVPDLELQEMSYQLMLLSQQYEEIKNPGNTGTIPTPTDQPEPTVSDTPEDELELYRISMSVLGSYEQIRSLLGDIESQKRAIRVNDFVIIVDQTIGKLDVELSLEFYGIAKLFSNSGDQVEPWPREPINGGVDNPYLEVTPVPMPSETTSETSESQAVEP